MIKITFIISLLTLFIACNNSPTDDIPFKNERTFYESGEVKQSKIFLSDSLTAINNYYEYAGGESGGMLFNGKKHGKWRWLYEDGKEKRSLYYEYGTLINDTINNSPAIDILDTLFIDSTYSFKLKSIYLKDAEVVELNSNKLKIKTTEGGNYTYNSTPFETGKSHITVNIYLGEEMIEIFKKQIYIKKQP